MRLPSLGEENTRARFVLVVVLTAGARTKTGSWGTGPRQTARLQLLSTGLDRTYVHCVATLPSLGSLIDVRRIAIAAFPVLALLVMSGGANAARARHALPPKCAPSSHTLLADAQAQVYAAREGSLKYLSIRGCAYGQRRSYIVAACGNGESATVCANESHVTLTGTVVASEDAFQAEGHQVEKSIYESYVEVRDLRTGHALHHVPTGTPLKPESEYVKYVGVGPVIGLVLKSDGAVAWIAEDYERSATQHGVGATYFDVYASDKAGTRLLASGTNVDPSSLALSVGSVDVGGHRRTIVGGTLYWTQGGTQFSASLN